MNWLTGLQNHLSSARPITRRELTRLDAASLLRRSRAMANAVYVGDNTVLCRVIGRYRLYVAAEDVGFGVHVMLDGLWEGWLTAFMARRIQPGMTVVDVGANHGYYTQMFAHLVGPDGRVAAVEPHPRTASLLRRSLYANGFQSWTTVHECAAGAEDGVALALYTPPNEPKNGHIVPDGGECPTNGCVTVTGARLDTLLADWPRVDFIKIDVEGAEEACLAGAWALIVRDRPMMVLEFNAYRSVDAAALLDRLTQVYGKIGVIQRDGSVGSVSRSILEDRVSRQDWMLFLQAD